MYSSTTNLSPLSFKMMRYTKSQQTIIMLHSIDFHYILRYILTGAKNIIFNLTILFKQNKRIGEYR